MEKELQEFKNYDTLDALLYDAQGYEITCLNHETGEVDIIFIDDVDTDYLTPLPPLDKLAPLGKTIQKFLIEKVEADKLLSASEEELDIYGEQFQEFRSTIAIIQLREWLYNNGYRIFSTL